MRVRAAKELSQLKDRDFFPAVAEGLDLIIKNVNRLQGGAKALSDLKAHWHASRVLATIAEEEAAKVLILLDAVRCPRKPHERLADQLGRFNNHLAKGLYARVCCMRPVTLADLQTYVDNDRGEFYLDGPNGVDWIFPNAILSDRESTFYVDYVERDEGNAWTDPAQLEDLISDAIEPLAVRTARFLYAAGLCSAAALAVIAEIWRAHPTTPDMHCSVVWDLNRRTLQELEARGLLLEQPTETYQWIFREWQFPMYDLNLLPIEVKVETLREQQRNWSPEGY